MIQHASLPGPGPGDDPPIYLRLSLTPRCDLRCRYCRPERSAGEPSLDGQLSLDELLEILRHIAKIRPIHKLRLTGGEPMLRPGLMDFIEKLRRTLPHARLCMTTNATRLKESARALKAAGIEAMNISIDTLDPERFEGLTRTKGLSRVIEGILAAHRAGFEPLKLNTVLMRSVNGDQLPSLIRLAAGCGAEIRFVELMPFGQGADLFGKEFLSGEEALERIVATFPYLGPAPPSSTAARHVIEVHGRPLFIGFITTISKLFCDRCDRIRLDSFGRLYACLRSEARVDLSFALRRARTDDLTASIARLLRSKTAPKPQAIWPARSMSNLGG